MTGSHALVSLLGRALLASPFILFGAEKLTGYAGTVEYMAAYGLPAVLLPLAIAVELGGGLAILFGVLSRWAAIALAVFCIITAVTFHRDFGDQMQLINFMKNLAMAGGLLLLSANGPGAYAIKD
jgi:putative oxidoreductase